LYVVQRGSRSAPQGHWTSKRPTPNPYTGRVLKKRYMCTMNWVDLYSVRCR